MINSSQHLKQFSNNSFPITSIRRCLNIQQLWIIGGVIFAVFQYSCSYTTTYWKNTNPSFSEGDGMKYWNIPIVIGEGRCIGVLLEYIFFTIVKNYWRVRDSWRCFRSWYHLEQLATSARVDLGSRPLPFLFVTTQAPTGYAGDVSLTFTLHIHVCKQFISVGLIWTWGKGNQTRNC